MTKYIKLLLPLSIVICLASCGVQYESAKVKSTSFTPDAVRLELDMNNFELLGEQEISVNFRTYLGFIPVLDSINGNLYDRRNVKVVALKGHKDLSLPRYMRKAAYKVIESYPSADYYVPVYVGKQIEKMFLGRTTRQTVMLKAYKLK